MSNEIRPAAKATWDDGYSEAWEASPGANVPPEALAEFVRACVKRNVPLISVEIVNQSDAQQATDVQARPTE